VKRTILVLLAHALVSGVALALSSSTVI